MQERIQNLEKQLSEANKHLTRLEVLEQVSVILNANYEFYTVVRLQQNALRYKNRRKKCGIILDKGEMSSGQRGKRCRRGHSSKFVVVVVVQLLTA